MNRASLRAAAWIVRTWTRVYTWHMPASVAWARRAEVDSDVWEFEHDAVATRALPRPLHVLLRLVLGIPDDLRWRVAHGARGGARTRQAVGLTAAALFLAIAWIAGELFGRQTLPPAPETPFRFVHGEPPVGPPAPPPPPPPRPRPRP